MKELMLRQLHPAVRVLGVVVGGLILLVFGSLAAYNGLKSLAQTNITVSAAPIAAAKPAQDNIANPTVMMKKARLVAVQSHGNWARVSPDDQRLLNGVTGGHGREMLRALAHEQAAKKP